MALLKFAICKKNLNSASDGSDFSGIKVLVGYPGMEQNAWKYMDILMR